MKCDLDILDSLILNKLNPENLIEEKSESNFMEWLSIAQKFKTDYQANIYSELFSLRDAKHIKSHIRCHQARFIFLSDKLYYFINLDVKKAKGLVNPPLGFITTQDSIYNILDELLCFLKVHFRKDFKFLYLVPKKLDKTVKEKFKLDLQNLKYRLVDGESKLWKIAFQPYEEFIKSERKSINYEEVEYLQDLLSELEVIPVSSLFKNDEELLKNTLLQNNFNSWHFSTT